MFAVRHIPYIAGRSSIAVIGNPPAGFPPQLSIFRRLVFHRGHRQSAGWLSTATIDIPSAGLPSRPSAIRRLLSAVRARAQVLYLRKPDCLNISNDSRTGFCRVIASSSRHDKHRISCQLSADCTGAIFIAIIIPQPGYLISGYSCHAVGQVMTASDPVITRTVFPYINNLIRVTLL